MKPSLEEIKKEIREYVQQHLAGKLRGKELLGNTPLISSGILDSISTMQMVVHVEKTFSVEFEAHEVDRDNFENIDTMASLISSKLG